MEKILKINNYEKLRENASVYQILNILKSNLNVVRGEKICKYIIAQDGKKTKNFIMLRMELLDWLLCVCKNLQQLDSTYFLTVEIFDKVMEAYNFSLDLTRMHFCLVVCLFVASKYNEVKSINLDTLLNDVCHNTFKQSEIVAGELIILKKLRFNLPTCHFYDFVNYILCVSYNETFKENSKIYNYKQIIFDYSKKVFKVMLYNKYANSLQTDFLVNLYAGVLFYSIFQTETLFKSQNILYFSKFISNLKSFNINKEEILKLLPKIKDQISSLEDNKAFFPYLNKEFEEFIDDLKKWKKGKNSFNL